MRLEYAIGVFMCGTSDYAIKAHRSRKQNPGVDVELDEDEVTLTLIGLQVGERETGDPPDPHLDFYVRPDIMCAYMADLPKPSVGPIRSTTITTHPWGTERAGGLRIQPGHTIAAVDILSARMRHGRDQLVASCAGGRLNIDFQIAPYGVPQFHFGVAGKWSSSTDGRVSNTWATISVSHDQYAELYDWLWAICISRREST